MAILIEGKLVTVLDVPKIDIVERFEYSQAIFQVYTGKDGLAGEMAVYSQADDWRNPTDLEGFTAGQYLVDVEEIRDRRNGRLSTRYVNLRPANKPQNKEVPKQ